MIDINLKEKYFFICKRKGSFALLNLNDLYVEVVEKEVFINSFVYNPDEKVWTPLLSHPEIPHEIKVASTFCETEVPVPFFHPVDVKDLNLNKDFTADVKAKSSVQFDEIKNDLSEISSRMIMKEEEVIAQVNILRDMLADMMRVDRQREELEERIEKLNFKIQNFTIENDLLKNNLKKAMTKVEILQNRINENSQSNSSKTKIFDDKALGLEDLIKGKTFEFLNSKVWFIKNETSNKGPLRFDELLALKESGELKVYKIKRNGELQWKDLQDVLELTAEVHLQYEDKANREKSIYLVQRGEYRADIREAVTFMIRDNEYRGYLTNISLSGGFIEIVKLDNVDHCKDKFGTLFFNEGLVSESISCDFKIKRVSDGRPKGIGFAFINVSQKNTEVLGQLISKIINSNNKIAA